MCAANGLPHDMGLVTTPSVEFIYNALRCKGLAQLAQVESFILVAVGRR